MQRPIPTRSPDTDAEADRVHIELLRSATPARRAALALSLTATIVGLARLALARQDPEASDERIGLRFVELNYGREIAAGLEAFLRTHRSMTTPDLVAAVQPIADAFERLGVRYYIGGSVASSTRGVPRASIDVDMAAELRPQHVAPFVAALQGQYYVTEDRVREAVAARRSFNAIHLATMMKVDVFVSRGRPFDRSAFERLTPEVLDAVSPSRGYPIPCAEDVILLKLEWFRAGGEVSDRQWGDVVGVIRVAGGALDRRYLARWAPELGVSDLLDRALAAAQAAG